MRTRDPVRWPPVLIAGVFVATAILYARNLSVHYPDEHFQTLELASHLINGYGWKAWEWQLGVRSWFAPAVYAPFVGLLSLCGLRFGPTPIYALKLFTSIAVLTGSLVGLRRTAFRNSPAGVVDPFLWGVVGVLILQPFFVYFATTTFTETLSIALVGALLPGWVALAEGGSRDLDAYAAGIRPTAPVDRGRVVFAAFAGLLFLLRIQNAFLLLGLIVPDLVRRDWKRAGSIALGVTIALLLSGALDWITWGVPFESTIQNIYWNVFRGIANAHGTNPFYFYGPAVADQAGWGFVAIALIAIIAQVLRRPTLYAGLGIFLAAHLAIPHKELRFLLPALPFVFLATIDSLGDLRAALRLRRKGSFLLFTALSLGLLLPAPKWDPALFATDYGISDLTFRAGSVLRELPVGQRRLLIVDGSWVWGRGEYGIGTRIEFKEVHDADVTRELLRQNEVILVGRRNIPVLRRLLLETHYEVYRDDYERTLWLTNGARN